MVVGDKLML